MDFEIEIKDWLREQTHVKLNLDDSTGPLNLLR